MVGSLEAPLGATGERSPLSQTYLFKGVSLIPADGSEAKAIYTGDPISRRIVNRPQIIYTTPDASDYEAIVYSAVTVQFDETVVVATAETSDNVIALDTGDITLNQQFTIDKGKAVTLTVRATWGKTVTVDADSGAETISSPAFALRFGTSDVD